MELKLFELRDVATFVPLLALKPNAGENDEFTAKMLWRYGWKESNSVIIMHVGDPGRYCSADPWEKPDRTYHTAHLHIVANWDTLKTGDLIDVRVLLGESDTPCASEAGPTPLPDPNAMQEGESFADYVKRRRCGP